MSYRLNRIGTAILLSVAVSAMHAQPTKELNVGDKVPAFKLADQDGQQKTLKDLSGSKGLLLLFNRSADWCPYCKSQLVDLEKTRHSFEEKGIKVASITYDSSAVLKAFSQRRNVHFEMLSDYDSQIIKAFGILNTEEKGERAGVAIPNFYLISPDGVIQKRVAETQLLDRVTVAYIYDSFFGIGASLPSSNTVVPKTPDLRLTLAQSDKETAPGARIRLVAKVDLPKGSHAYASGAEQFGYRPLKLTLEQSSLYQFHDPEYGKSVKRNVAGLGDKVPVFESSTVISQDLWAIRSPETNKLFAQQPDLPIRGVLEYQVCTDSKCFSPQKVPVQWQLHVLPSDLDTTRVAEDLRRK